MHLRYFSVLLLPFLAACSDSSDMATAPSSVSSLDTPAVGNAQALVGGIPVQGVVTRGTDQPVLFRVRVQAPGGLSSIGRVVMQYAQPGANHQGPMMGGFSGSVLCYDDGTHGDDMPGDGMYHYQDPDDRIGCHGSNAPAGEYRYSFWCETVQALRSNTVSLTIIRQ